MGQGAGPCAFPGRQVWERGQKRPVNGALKMASGRKNGANSRLEKNGNGRRSSKFREGPVGKFIHRCFHVVTAPPSPPPCY